MSEDAHEIAQRIVREVLDAHDAEVARATPPAASAEDAVPASALEIDLREAPAAVAPDAGAALLDDSTARLTARRIVAEVLASHAQAERDITDDLPVAAEGEAPGPASATPVLHPVSGRPAVLPSLPDEPDPDADADLADDAAAIARRIVASVLNQRPPAADEGPPPLPGHLRTPADHVPAVDVDADAHTDADATAEPDAETDVETDAAEVEPVAEVEPDVGVEPAPELEVDPVVVHGSHRLTPPEDETPAVDPDAPTAVHAAVPVEPDPTPESTALLTPDEPADTDATTRVPVATLERPVADQVTLDPTLSLPSAEPPRRTGRWLLASILGAVALAVLLPLAVQALRTLVSLS